MLTTQLQDALEEHDLTLGIAISSAIEGHVKFIQEASATINHILETAPSDNNIENG